MENGKSSAKYNRLMNQMNQNFIENSENYERPSKSIKKDKILLEL